MDFDYFYGRDSEGFRFIRLPIVLIEDEKFKGLSIDAKVLYSMYLSRSTLSYKNNWIDENGRVFIYFTVEETAEQLGCVFFASINSPLLLKVFPQASVRNFFVHLCHSNE